MRRFVEKKLRLLVFLPSDQKHGDVVDYDLMVNFVNANISILKEFLFNHLLYYLIISEKQIFILYTMQWHHMSIMTSQITSNLTTCSTACSGLHLSST